MRRMLLAAALLLAVPTLPATGGVELVLQGSGTWVGEAPGSEAYASGGSMALQLSQTTSVRLLSSLTDPAGQRVDHVATWNLAGAQWTSNRTAAPSTGTLAAGSHALGVALVVPQAMAGSYRLDLVTRAAATSGSGASGTTASSALVITVDVPTVGGAAPGRVEGLTGILSSGRPRLDWSAASDPQGDAVSYEILRSTSPAFNVANAAVHATTSARSFVDDAVEAGVAYHYRVRAVDPGGHRGLASAEVRVVTPPPPDTTPPSAVTGLEVHNPTNRSISLRWGAAVDDRSAVTYWVARDDDVVGSTQFTFYTDDGLRAEATFAYRVTPVDAAGNVGPASLVAGSTLADPEPLPPPAGTQANASSSSSSTASSSSSSSAAPSSTSSTSQSTTGAPPAEIAAPIDRTPPTVRGIAVAAGPGRTVVSWETDEPARSQLHLVAPARTLAAGNGTRFAVDLGSLQPGPYRFHIAATDLAGNTVQVTSQFLQGEGSEHQVRIEGSLATQIAALAGGSLPVALFATDQDGDGLPEALVDAAGHLKQVHAMPSARRALVEAGSGSLVLVDLAAGTASAVDRRPASVVASDDQGDVWQVTVRIDKPVGWIAASVADPRPGQPLLAIERSDGTPVPVDQAWRTDGTLHFLDDPAATYQLQFDDAVPLAEASGREPGGSDSRGSPAAGPLLVLAALALAIARRRPA